MKILKYLRINLKNWHKLQDGQSSQSSSATAKTDMDGDQSNIQTLKSTEQLNTVSPDVLSNIRDLPLLVFIQCCVYSNYTGLNCALEVQEEVWLKLLSQFFVARCDTNINDKLSVMSEMEHLKFRIDWINVIIERIGVIYRKEYADELREVFSEYGFEFTEESFASDIVLVKNIEVQSKIRHSELAESLKVLNEDVEKKTKEQKEIDFYESVESHNRIFSGSRRVSEMNALEYALCCKAIEKYIEDQNKENQKAT